MLLLPRDEKRIGRGWSVLSELSGRRSSPSNTDVFVASCQDCVLPSTALDVLGYRVVQAPCLPHLIMYAGCRQVGPSTPLRLAVRTTSQKRRQDPVARSGSMAAVRCTRGPGGQLSQQCRLSGFRFFRFRLAVLRELTARLSSIFPNVAVTPIPASRMLCDVVSLRSSRGKAFFGPLMESQTNLYPLEVTIDMG